MVVATTKTPVGNQASKPAKTKGPGPVKGFSVQMSENGGYVVNLNRQHGEAYSYDYDAKPLTFGSFDEMMKALKGYCK